MFVFSHSRESRGVYYWHVVIHFSSLRPRVVRQYLVSSVTCLPPPRMDLTTVRRRTAFHWTSVVGCGVKATEQL